MSNGIRLALDTNRYVDFTRGDADAVEQLTIAAEIRVPFIVAAELRSGFLYGSRSAENERSLSRFLRSARVYLLFADEQTTHHYAALSVQLRKQGTPIPINDLWIAALVQQNGLTLYARDAHFDHLPQIPRI